MMLVFALGLSWALALQGWSGARTADLAGDPDEAAHAVTALMIRDYLVEGPGQSPLAFANGYYEDFPKIALGHYPPFYYAVASLPLLVWPSSTALLVLQAVLFAIFMGLLWILARTYLSPLETTAVCIVVGLSPVTQDLCNWVMSDLLLINLCLGSVLAWLNYLKEPSLGRSLLFGVLASLALLTKGSALLLALIPPASTALLRKWPEFGRWRWWAAAVPVVLTAGPWFAISMRITQEGMSHLSVSEFVPVALRYYGRELPDAVGWAVLLAFGVWLAFRVLPRPGKRPIDAFEAVALAWIAGGVAVAVCVPAGMSARYLFPILAPLAILGVRGLGQLTGERRVSFRVSMAAFVAVTLWQIGSLRKKEESGFGTAVKAVLSEADFETHATWLVSSDPRGEGAIIAAAAFSLPDRTPNRLTVLRTSKELADTDWMGRSYEAEFNDPLKLLAHLKARDIDTVLFDESLPAKWRKEHHRLLGQALEMAKDEWRVEFTQAIRRRAGQSGQMKVYVRTATSP